MADKICRHNGNRVIVYNMELIRRLYEEIWIESLYTILSVKLTG